MTTEQKNKVIAKCDKVIIDKNWTGTYKRKCDRNSVTVDVHGRHLCGHHLKQWNKKVSKHNSLPQQLKQ